MAITIREEQSVASNSVALSFTLGAGTQVDDTILLIHMNNFHALANLQTPTGTAVTTWTERHSLDGGLDDSHAKVWTGTVTTGGTATVLPNGSTTDEERYAQVLVLVGAVDFDTAASTDADTGSTSHVAPSVTPTSGKTDDLLVCTFQAATASINYTMPGGMTAYTEQDVGGFATYRSASEQLASDVATGTRTATASASGVWAAVSVLMKSTTAPPALAFVRPVQAPYIW